MPVWIPSVIAGFGALVSVINVIILVWLGFRANARLERLKGELQGDLDSLVRRRAIYEKLAPALAAFGTPNDERKAVFEESYALAYIWAPEQVLSALDAFLATAIVKDGRFQGTEEERNSAYDKCMMEMRKDAGYPETGIAFRRVSF